MYNLIQIQDAIKGLPIQDVMKYARGSNPDVPAYLALAELNRRKQIQDTSTAFYGEPQTVREQIENSLTGAPQGQVNPAAAPQMANPTIPPQLQTLTAPPPKQPSAIPQQVNPAAAPPVPAMMRKGGLASLPVGMFKRANYAGGGIIAFDEGGSTNRSAFQQDLIDFFGYSQEKDTSPYERDIKPKLEKLKSYFTEPRARKYTPQELDDIARGQGVFPEGSPALPGEPPKPTNQQASATTSGQIVEKKEPVKPLFGQKVTVTQPDLTDEQLFERRRKLQELAGVSADPYADIKKRYADIEARRKADEEGDTMRSVTAGLRGFAQAKATDPFGVQLASAGDKMAALDKEQTALRDKQATAMAELQLGMAKEEDARKRGDVTAIEAARDAQQKAKMEMAKLEVEQVKAQAAMISAGRPSQIMELANLYRTNPELAAKVQGISKTGGLSADDIVKILSTDPTFMSMTPEQKIATVRAAMGGAAAAAPAVGTVKDGYRFKGGNPADKNSWEKV